MMKRILCALTAAFLLMTFGSCKKLGNPGDVTHSNTDFKTDATDKDPVQTGDETKDNSANEKDEEMITTTYNLTHATKGVKVLGVRCLKSDSQINCDWTGSGIEMKINHKGGDIVFTAKATGGCLFKAYVDEVLQKTPLMYSTVTDELTRIVIENIDPGEHTVRLIKVTGHTLARATLYNITFAGSIIEDGVRDNDLYIEFVGDSISCGWGTIGTYDGSFASQDGELAYPLRTSQALGADYSVTALSGQGLLYGTLRIDEGYLLSSMLRDRTERYDFARKADIVVVNVGTNDYNKTGITEEDFKSAYLNFLNVVKQKNGSDCKIVCVYNVMNDTYANAIKSAASEAGGENSGIYLLKLDRSTNPYAVGHPSVEDNEKYTRVLTAFIKKIAE